MEFDAAREQGAAPGTTSSPGPQVAEEPRGDALWEMALEGMDWAQAPKPFRVPVRKRQDHLRTKIAVGVGVLLAGIGAIWFAGARVTSAPSPAPQTLTPTGQVGPAPGSAGDSRAGTACSVQPVTPDPPAGGTTDVMVTGAPTGSAITVAVSYAGGTTRSSVTADGSGVSYVAVNLSSAPAGSPVRVSVSAGATSCHTSFTPSAAGAPAS